MAEPHSNLLTIMLNTLPHQSLYPFLTYHLHFELFNLIEIKRKKICYADSYIICRAWVLDQSTCYWAWKKYFSKGFLTTLPHDLKKVLLILLPRHNFYIKSSDEPVVFFLKFKICCLHICHYPLHGLQLWKFQKHW